MDQIVAAPADAETLLRFMAIVHVGFFAALFGLAGLFRLMDWLGKRTPR